MHVLFKYPLFSSSVFCGGLAVEYNNLRQYNILTGLVTQYPHSINKYAHMQVTIIGRKCIAHSPSMSFVLNFAWCFLFSYWCIIQYSIHDTSIIWYTDSKNHNSDEYSKFDTLHLQVTILPMTYGMRHSPPSWRSPSLW